MIRAYKILIFILICLVLTVIASYLILSSWNPFGPQPDTYLGYEALPFSKQAWSQADAEKRGYMANDLLKSYNLVGMSQKEALSLLGKPDYLAKESGSNRPSSISYKLGYMGYNPKAFLVFDYRLHINFKGGIVTNVSIDD